MNDKAPLLRLEEVHKRYGDAEVLRGIDLDVPSRTRWCASSAPPGSRQVHAAQVREPDRAGRRRGGSCFDGEDITAPERRRRRACAAASASSSRPSTCSRT